MILISIISLVSYSYKSYIIWLVYTFSIWESFSFANICDMNIMLISGGADETMWKMQRSEILVLILYNWWNWIYNMNYAM